MFCYETYQRLIFHPNHWNSHPHHTVEWLEVSCPTVTLAENSVERILWSGQVGNQQLAVMLAGLGMEFPLTGRLSGSQEPEVTLSKPSRDLAGLCDSNMALISLVVVF